MAIFRRPKGTYVRTTPDWYISRMATIGFDYVASTSQGTTTFTIYEFYNNSPRGQKLHIYGLQTNFQFSTVALISMYSGFKGNDTGQNPISIDGSLGQPPGKLYFRTVVLSGSGTFWNQSFQTVVGNTGNGNSVVNLQWPAFIVPAGYSLAVVGNTGGKEDSIGIWYMPDPDY